MTIKQIARILDNHSVEYKIENNNIFMKSEYTYNCKLGWDYINMTNFNLEQLKNELGY